MKSTWFSTEYNKRFAKLIHEADYSVADYDKYNLWLQCTFIAFRQACYKLHNPTINQEWEDEYLKLIARVRHPDNFAKALGVLVDALDVDQPQDVLGGVLSEWGQNDSKWKGQLFTPASVSDLMAKMTLYDVTPNRYETLWLSEPACGAGQMIISASNVLKDNGFFPWHYHWTAVDVDHRCYMMTLLQTTLLGIPCVCVHGNTLSLEVFDQQRNLISLMHPPKPKRTFQPLSDLAKSCQEFMERISC